MKTDKLINVLVVDDHPLYREGINRILSEFSVIKNCTQAENGLEALKLCHDNVYDIIFMDIEMPKMNGIEASAEILKLHPDSNIIILTSFNHKRQIIDLLSLGVRGYVLKNTNKDEIEIAINKVLSGDLYLTSEIKDIYMQHLIAEANRNKNYKEHFDFTDREIEILKEICEQKSSTEIAEKFNISENTVQNHRQKMMKKIGTDNVVGLVIYAIKMGYYFP